LSQLHHEKNPVTMNELQHYVAMASGKAASQKPLGNKMLLL